MILVSSDECSSVLPDGHMRTIYWTSDLSSAYITLNVDRTNSIVTPKSLVGKQQTVQRNSGAGCYSMLSDGVGLCVMASDYDGMLIQADVRIMLM